MMQQKSRALMSYAHSDDQKDIEFFARLRERLSQEIRLRTGVEFQIFQDTEEVRWGQYFQERVEDTMQSLTFFIPIVTPSFFRSEYCREELRRFFRREESLQRHDLIVPIYYIEYEPFETPSILSNDVLVQSIAERLQMDWRKLRKAPFDTPQMQSMVDMLVTQIQRAMSPERHSIEPAESEAESSPTHSIADEAQPVEMSSPTPAPAKKSEIHPPLTMDGVFSSASSSHVVYLQGLLQQNGGTIVHTVAFSPDRRLFALGGRDNIVHIWDMTDAEEVHRFEGHSDYIVGLAFSPDGRLLASASRDKTIRLWSVAGEREARRLEGHTARLVDVAFSPDGKLLASCSQDKTVRLWDVAKEKQLRRLEGHTRLVTKITFSPDGKLLASSSEDNTVRIWEVLSGREMQRLDRHTDHTRCVAFSPDGSVIASASDDSTIFLWDVATGRVIRRLQYHTGGVESVAFSPSGKVLATGGRDQTVRLYEIAHDQTSVPEDNKWGKNRRALLWEMGSDRELVQLPRGRDIPRRMAFSNDGMLLALVCDTYTVRICGLGLPDHDWARIEQAWHDVHERKRQRRHKSGRCEECGERLTILDKLSRQTLCKECR